MKRVLPAIFLFCAMAQNTLAAEVLTGVDPYHPAITVPEKALNAIILKAGNDPYVLDNLFHGHPVPKASQADYGTMLTPALLAALTAAQNAQLKQYCNGSYSEGQSCGLDYNPISCGQDVSPVYLYDTQSANAQSVTIASKWPSEPYINIYRLVRSADGWKIDGVACGGAGSFHMP